MMLAPTINILRHPAWGRAQETYGEDPFLLGRLGSAFTVGVQRHVATCPKHYAANNIENGRQSANAMMDEQTLREIYARHFEMVIEEGGAVRDHGRLQPGQRQEGDAEPAPAHRPAAHRLRLRGVRAQRLVGDAERRKP
jgi:beta-glucosidase-like glycosyl hydrolase